MPFFLLSASPLCPLPVVSCIFYSVSSLSLPPACVWYFAACTPPSSFFLSLNLPLCPNSQKYTNRIYHPVFVLLLNFSWESLNSLLSQSENFLLQKIFLLREFLANQINFRGTTGFCLAFWLVIVRHLNNSKHNRITRKLVRIIQKTQALRAGGTPFFSFALLPPLVRSLSAKYRLDRYRRDKSVKFSTELP